MLFENATAHVNTIELEATDEQVLAAITAVDALKERVRDLAAAMEERVIAWLNAHPEIQLVSGDVRYYVGADRKTKCVNAAGVLEKLFDHSAGDFATVVTFLSSDPFKPGACKSAMSEDDFGQLFSTTTIEDLKTGKPLKRLQKVNDRFVPKKKGP